MAVGASPRFGTTTVRSTDGSPATISGTLSKVS